MVAWLLATLRSTGPYLLLTISGEQGSAKTVLCKLIKVLTDTNVAPVPVLPFVLIELLAILTLYCGNDIGCSSEFSTSRVSDSFANHSKFASLLLTHIRPISKTGPVCRCD